MSFVLYVVFGEKLIFPQSKIGNTRRKRGCVLGALKAFSKWMSSPATNLQERMLAWLWLCSLASALYCVVFRAPQTSPSFLTTNSQGLPSPSLLSMSLTHFNVQTSYHERLNSCLASFCISNPSSP